MSYPNTQLFINGQWCDAEGGRTLPVFNPATGTEIGRLAHAGIPDLERAAQAAQKGFELWRDMPANERSAIMRKLAGSTKRNMRCWLIPLIRAARLRSNSIIGGSTRS